jgi:predicted TIM-barrel fold metal-dependent hydrolase
MAAYSGPIIDVDVHHTWPREEDVVAYLPQRWRDFIAGHGTPLSLKPPRNSVPSTIGTNKRLDSFPENGGPPGSDYPTMKRQLLDEHRVVAAMLTFDVGYEGSHRNPDFSIAVARAVNDWNADTWLKIPDERIRSAPVIPAELPEEAAAEIRRVAQNERISEVLLVANPNYKPFGHPFYFPIYEVADELDLPISIHVSGSDPGQVYQAAGIPGSRTEWTFHLCQAAHLYISSFIVSGAFERFRNLRILLAEFGVAWLPWLMWALDDQYERLRAESPWVKKWPSEYIRDRVRLSTQPLETTSPPDHLLNMLASLDGVEDLICFATDYPHWDVDNPGFIARQIPKAWHDKLFYENARSFYGSRLTLPRRAADVPEVVHVA